MDIEEKYLPLGTVVMLKKGFVKVMIAGYCAKLEEENKKIYDYIGCLFPYGIFTTEQTLVFDHSDIKKIYYKGLNDEDMQQLNIKLKNVMNNINI